jgi:hypothetical protein
MLSVEYFVYIAFAFALAGYLARDELWLRLLLLAASANYIAYYWTVAEGPLGDAILTSGALAAVNLVMIGVVILERSTFAMSPQMAAIYRSFDMLTPGQFRRIMRHGTVRTADGVVRLTTEGMRVDRLCYVTEAGLRHEGRPADRDARPHLRGRDRLLHRKRRLGDGRGRAGRGLGGVGPGPRSAASRGAFPRWAWRWWRSSTRTCSARSPPRSPSGGRRSDPVRRRGSRAPPG